MKQLLFSETLAHPNDLLPVHLERVANQAMNSIAPSAKPPARLIAFLAGLFHDMGKATSYFQDYLLKTQKKTPLTPHAKTGAILSWWYTGEMQLSLWIRLSVFIAVLRHHGALNYDNWRRLLINVRPELEDADSPVMKQLKSLDLVGIQHWLENLAHRQTELSLPSTTFALPSVLPPLSLENIIAQIKVPSGVQLRKAFQDLEQAVMFVAGLGGLLAMDKLESAMLKGSTRSVGTRRELPCQAVRVFKASHFSLMGNLDIRREKIATEVEQTWLAHLDKSLFTLTAPTGAGKTLTILNAALAVRAEIKKRQGYEARIIYCLPFTAVIDQNYAVFRGVLKANQLADREDLLLKHHHLVNGFYRTVKEEQEKVIEHKPDGAGQLLTETWQSELVVTTFYQLLHSLLSKQNTNVKRAGQLTGSIVLMDEVQAIPLKYWQALRILFQTVAQCLGTRFVLLTATRPLIFRPQDENVTELLPNHLEHFRALSRVQLTWHHQDYLTLKNFADYLIDQHSADTRSILIIVNRTKSVQVLFENLQTAFPHHKIIALSRLLTPKDKQARIRLLQRLLRHQQPCWVIATQLVEAGVDVSFPVVHREFAPLDSVIQSAGRCNRHNEGAQMGEVHLWRLCDAQEDGQVNVNKPLYQRVYDLPLIEATEIALGKQEIWQESDFLPLSQRYFEQCWQSQQQAEVDDWLKAGDFDKINRDFQLIVKKHPQRSLFIVGKNKQGDLCQKDEKLWHQYQSIYENRQLSPLEQEQAFAKFRKSFYERVIQVNEYPDPTEPITRVEAGANTYSKQTGFIAMPKEPSICIC